MKLCVEADWDRYAGVSRSLVIGRYRAHVEYLPEPMSCWAWRVYKDASVEPYEGALDVADDLSAMRDAEGAIIELHFTDNMGSPSAVPSFPPARITKHWGHPSEEKKS